MAGKRRPTRLRAPFLTRVTLRDGPPDPGAGHPFSLPWLRDEDFEIAFTTPVTIVVGENGVGKSTLIEALAALAGFGAGGGNRNHGGASDESSGAQLSDILRGAWLPKMTQGWFFRAETFHTLARYLDDADSPTADFLSWSHGEGFARVFAERMAGQGIYFMDEPESALSPKRQLDLVALLADMQETGRAQAIVATHSPLIMAVPGARVLQVSRFGFLERAWQETSHFRLWRAFAADPEGFIAEAIDERRDGDERFD